MTPAARRAGAAAALLAAAGWLGACAAGAAAACELVLDEHRSGRALARLPLDARAPEARIAFTHSVLGTPVLDRYRFRPGPQGWRAHLVEERFEGEGYGLPAAAGPGERLVRDGDGWRLETDRLVDPLVVRPLPAQRMRVTVAGRPALPLAALSDAAIALRAVGCGPDPR